MAVRPNSALSLVTLIQIAAPAEGELRARLPMQSPAPVARRPVAWGPSEY
jgi:hypothetical protein